MAQYHYLFSEAYLLESVERYRAQMTKRLWRIPLKAFCFLGLAVLLAICLFANVFVPSLVFAFFLLLLLAGPRIDYWLMMRKFRKSPFYNNDVIATVTDDGYKCECESARVEMPWKTFTKVRRMRDGFLIFNGPQQYHWWPDSALEGGSVVDVEQLLQKFISEYSA